ncbi:MAG: hypothetical protein AB7P04_11420 [Bacteriovoracia bacterium]
MRWVVATMVGIGMLANGVLADAAVSKTKSAKTRLAPKTAKTVRPNPKLAVTKKSKTTKSTVKKMAKPTRPAKTGATRPAATPAGNPRVSKPNSREPRKALNLVALTRGNSKLYFQRGVNSMVNSTRAELPSTTDAVREGNLRRTGGTGYEVFSTNTIKE